MFFTAYQSTFTTTAGVIRAGGVARPASGAQQPSANQQRRWIAPSTLRRDVLSQDSQHNDFVFRRVRGILNKITPEKFEKLSADILNIIGQGSPTIFKGVILLIFEKALDEPKYSSMYAQLCKRLAEQAPNFESSDDKITTFKRLLLRQCRDEFENRAAVSSAYDKRIGNLSGDEEENRFLAKRKMLGNIKFIGELGKLEMLHDSILHRCCEQLLVGRRKQPIHDQIEDLECLAHLFKTCGRVLDTAKAKPLVDQYFDRLRAIIANNDTPTRIKFLLQDVIEMRENRWMPRKLVTPDGPRTIQQVREDAARDGCIYLPQQDANAMKAASSAKPSHLQALLFSKSRPKGMDDIFGGPGPQGPAGLGIGPGVIGGETDTPNGNFNYRNGTTFEEKFNGNNVSYREESRDHRSDFKPKRDSFENKFVERPDFGDRFTANRNKTHPSNRGKGFSGAPGLMGSSRDVPTYGGGPAQHGSGEKDLPPRFKRMGMGMGGDNPPALRPSANSMMLKPKTPSSLPKSAMSKLEGPNSGSGGIPKVMMTTAEPAVIISKQSGSKKKEQEKKNQGPTRDEVFSRVDDILAKLIEDGSTNQAFTAWKEGDIPGKMANNALIHFFKQVVKLPDASHRQLAFQLVEQLCGEEVVTQIHCKEGLARLVQFYSSLEMVEGGLADLAAWCLTTDKIKLVDLAEMTEGGATHPFFLIILQGMAVLDEQELLAAFKESGIKLLDQLPPELRTEEELGRVLDERKLTFLLPLLHIKAEIWRQLEAEPTTEAFMAWLEATVPAAHRTDPAFILALVHNIIRFVTERTGDNSGSNDAAVSEKKEKELILNLKPILQAFIRNSPVLQLTAVYAMQVFCFHKQFPKGMLLRWFVALYEADIIEENVFLKWKEDVNDAYPGKGKALFQVNQWLTWLEEAESEEEEEEED